MAGVERCLFPPKTRRKQARERHDTTQLSRAQESKEKKCKKRRPAQCTRGLSSLLSSPFLSFPSFHTHTYGTPPPPTPLPLPPPPTPPSSFSNSVPVAKLLPLPLHDAGHLQHFQRRRQFVGPEAVLLAGQREGEAVGVVPVIGGGCRGVDGLINHVGG
jgi:hypothetical protein